MDNQAFWDILNLLNWKKQGNDDLVLKPAVKALSKMDVEEIHAFDEMMAEKLHALDTRKIAALAYKNVENISSDDFLYVSCLALINGPEYYDKVLNLQEALDKDMEFEAILYLAQDAYELKTGKDYDYSTTADYESFANAEGWK